MPQIVYDYSPSEIVRWNAVKEEEKVIYLFESILNHQDKKDILMNEVPL